MDEQRTTRPVEGQALDAESMSELWQRHRRWVAAILLAHKPKWADLDDLLQEVATSVVRKVGDLRDEGALKPWLRTVAINAAQAAGRKGARRGTPLSLDASPDVTAIPVSDGSVRDEAKRVLALAGQLPDGYREPLLMKAVQGMSYRQIGEVMGLPETTVETRIARGRRMLRELVDAADEAAPEKALAQR